MNRRLKHILTEFMQKMRFKYRISIVNENTLEETWYTKLSRFSVVLFVTGFFLFTFILLTLVIFATPLRHYLPGYADSGNRTTIIQQSMRADSLSRQVNLMNAYLEVLKENIEGTHNPDTSVLNDTTALKERATVLMEKSKREEEFVKAYEETEKYNLGTINPTETNEKM